MSAFVMGLHAGSGVWAQAMIRGCGQGGLALAIAWALCTCFRKAPAKLKCWIWRLAYLKLLIAVLWATPVPLALLHAPRVAAVTPPMAAPMAVAAGSPETLTPRHAATPDLIAPPASMTPHDE